MASFDMPRGVEQKQTYIERLSNYAESIDGASIFLLPTHKSLSAASQLKAKKIFPKW